MRRSSRPECPFWKSEDAPTDSATSSVVALVKKRLIGEGDAANAADDDVVQDLDAEKLTSVPEALSECPVFRRWLGISRWVVMDENGRCGVREDRLLSSERSRRFCPPYWTGCLLGWTAQFACCGRDLSARLAQRLLPQRAEAVNSDSVAACKPHPIKRGHFEMPTEYDVFHSAPKRLGDCFAASGGP
jgi:hypothetical protein